MRNFQAERRFRKFLYSPLSIGLLLVIVFFLAKGVWGAYQKYALTENLLTETRREHTRLIERTATLQKDTQRLSTERGIEEEIRKNFQVAKPGEEVVVLVGTTATTSEEQTVSTVTKSWWQFWK